MWREEDNSQVDQPFERKFPFNQQQSAQQQQQNQMMASISRTSDILKQNLHRCSLKSDSLFTTGRFKNIKENLLLEISSKWDSTFCGKNELKPLDTISSETSPSARKPKIRSVYGQPEIGTSSGNPGLHPVSWRSLDSLDTCDSGHSVGSNSTSLSDLRALDLYRNVDLSALISDLGTSVESSDNEQELYKRCTSSNSTSSGCSIDIEDEEAREAKCFMKQFVLKIFDNR